MCCQQVAQTSQQSLCKTICEGVQIELSEILKKSDLYGPNLRGEVTALMKRPILCPTYATLLVYPTATFPLPPMVVVIYLD
jgi:hypothetical protein